eukprot:g15618.t1
MYNYHRNNMTAKEMEGADFIKRGAHADNRDLRQGAVESMLDVNEEYLYNKAGRKLEDMRKVPTLPPESVKLMNRVQKIACYVSVVSCPFICFMCYFSPFMWIATYMLRGRTKETQEVNLLLKHMVNAQIFYKLLVIFLTVVFFPLCVIHIGDGMNDHPYQGNTHFRKWIRKIVDILEDLNLATVDGSGHSSWFGLITFFMFVNLIAGIAVVCVIWRLLTLLKEIMIRVKEMIELEADGIDISINNGFGQAALMGLEDQWDTYATGESDRTLATFDNHGGAPRGSKDDPFARVAGTEVDAGHVWGVDHQADIQMRLAMEIEAHNVRGDEKVTMTVREREDWYEAQGDEKFVKDTNAHFADQLDGEMGWATGKPGSGGKVGKTGKVGQNGKVKGAPNDNDDGGAQIAGKAGDIGKTVGKQMKGVSGKINKAAGTMGGKAGKTHQHAAGKGPAGAAKAADLPGHNSWQK